jgi:hypothetical protein
MATRLGSLIAALVLTAAVVVRAGSAARTQITVWSAPAGDSSAGFGGVAYGGVAPTTGALVTEHRDLELGRGEVRITGIAADLEPASVHIRDLTDPDAVITELRFLAGAATPTDLIAHHIGEPVTVVTQKAEIAGVLRAVDDQVLVVEVGTGDQRRLEMMQRDGFVQSMRLAAGAGVDRPSLVWRVRTARPGRHAVELSYRTEGLAWTADYLAVLNEAGTAIDFAARATIKNATGASFDAAELTLIHSGPQAAGTGAPPLRFAVATPVRIAQGEAVQIDLVPPRVAARARTVTAVEWPHDLASATGEPATDCTQGGSGEPGQAELMVELDVPGGTLPEGKARLLRRRAGRLEVVTEEPLHSGAGLARIRIAPTHELTVERRAASCSFDEVAHTLREVIEISIENTGAAPADVVARDRLWRWSVWRIESEGRKGTRAAPQVQEYRVRVPAGGKQSLTYTAVYAW